MKRATRARHAARDFRLTTHAGLVRGTYEKGFLETSDEMGTLSDVLEESGYRLEDGEWHAPQFVALDHLSVGVG